MSAAQISQPGSAPIATTSMPGLVQPDGTTITVSNGVISGGAAGPPTTDYWSWDFSAPAIAIIETDFVTAQSLVGSWNSLAGHEQKSAGKLYLELHILETNSKSGIGFTENAGLPLFSYPGSSEGFGFISDGGAFNTLGGSISGSGWMTQGNVVGLAIDFTDGTATLYVNNVSVGSLSGATIGAGHVTLGFNGGGGRFRLATTAAQCTYSPPAGYSNWN